MSYESIVLVAVHDQWLVGCSHLDHVVGVERGSFCFHKEKYTDVDRYENQREPGDAVYYRRVVGSV